MSLEIALCMNNNTQSTIASLIKEYYSCYGDYLRATDILKKEIGTFSTIFKKSDFDKVNMHVEYVYLKSNTLKDHLEENESRFVDITPEESSFYNTVYNCIITYCKVCVSLMDTIEYHKLISEKKTNASWKISRQLNIKYKKLRKELEFYNSKLYIQINS